MRAPHETSSPHQTPVHDQMLQNARRCLLVAATAVLGLSGAGGCRLFSPPPIESGVYRYGDASGNPRGVTSDAVVILDEEKLWLLMPSELIIATGWLHGSHLQFTNALQHNGRPALFEGELLSPTTFALRLRGGRPEFTWQRDAADGCLAELTARHDAMRTSAADATGSRAELDTALQQILIRCRAK